MSAASAEVQRVGVFGAGGRMGRAVCQAVIDDPGDGARSRVDPEFAGIDLRQVTGSPAVRRDSDRRRPRESSNAPEPKWQSTSPSRQRHTKTWLVRVARRARGCRHHGSLAGRRSTSCAQSFDVFEANCVLAANFAIGAVLMARFCELAAPFMDGVEIIELHHDDEGGRPVGNRYTHRAARRRSPRARVWSGSFSR